MDVIIPSGENRLDVTLCPSNRPPFNLKGKGAVKRVSAGTAQIYSGEFVRDVKELEELAVLRFALDGVKVLDAAKTGDKRVTVVYTQNGKTYAKAAKWENNAISLGNSLEISAQPLANAAITPVGLDTAAIFYVADCAGQVAVVSYADRVGTLKYTDLWLDEDAYNLTVSKLDTERVLVSCVLPRTLKARLCIVKIAAVEVWSGSPLYLPGAYDTDEYSGGWSLAALSPTRAVVSYFVGYAKAIGFSLLTADGDAVREDFAGSCYYLGGLPATSVAAASEKSFIFCNGVTRIAPGAANKTLMAAEGWYLTEYAAKPFWAGRVTTATDKAISQVDAAMMGPGMICMGYALDGAHCGALAKNDDLTPELYPAVPVEPVPSFGRLIPLNGSYAMMAYQAGGCGYVKVLGVAETVVPTDAEPDGVAKSNGTAGGPINVIIPS